MSKRKPPILLTFFAGAFHIIFSATAAAQYLEANLNVDTESKVATVNGKWAATPNGRRNLTFLRSAIGAPDLGSRISGVVLKDKDGRQVAYRKFDSAEYVADTEFSEFSYNLDLKPFKDQRSAAHSSWIGKSEGLLFLDDLVPQTGGSNSKRALISIQVPRDWKLVGVEKPISSGGFDIENIERSIFAVGKGLREVKGSAEKDELNITMSGQWHFGDAEATVTAKSIYREYVDLFAEEPSEKPLIVLFPFPQPDVQRGTWEAETRGSTVLIVSADTAFKSQSQQRLHEQLRHEIFHLWLPNGVNLTGRYDWFYEGFALYQSLKTGVKLNQIRFEDFLETISRAYNIDQSNARPRSLIEASQERWSGADTQVYARGMVVAFLSDLTLLHNSKGKLSIESILKDIFASNKFPAVSSDGNTAVLRRLDADPKLAVIADNYVRGAKPIDWAAVVEAAGLENESGSSRAALRVKSKLTGRQKALLDKLGYNNWRKLTRK